MDVNVKSKESKRKKKSDEHFQEINLYSRALPRSVGAVMDEEEELRKKR